ncbi:aldo/keto reductase [Victivallis vadensis]|uniref:L-glyceraldehyde 3-phosphate reductase n=1 Tax=Victivallis vadensis TaxID=172901 RepID=A0A2U1AEI2_9BACT|nr:aldo/keto reductase [Victivallis vadensis]PVY34766.1 L-glyceraldehyde 3-phosphate reductase [Victivallis vadensis]PWM88826.1 MAG: L-glyceraldehyde 3-phosphate reductase [Lentisphaerota bacterium]
MLYSPAENRYDSMPYRRCGRSGLRLPAVSLGLWHNFGSVDVYDNCRAMARTAFDLGITHFDLANNYGPEPGSAEVTFGRILKQDLMPFRDELIISSKAGYLMWPGPYGEWGSRKNLIASCDQSLKRMGLEYVDIFYHHRPDPDTPVEESMLALDQLVRSGKALYVGISNYGPEAAKEAIAILRELKTPFVLHQIRYNMFDRTHERQGSFKLLEEQGVGGIVFSPLAQGLLTDRYLAGIPADSRASRNGFLKADSITEEVLAKIRNLNGVAKSRGQSLAEMAIAWLLNRPGVTSALIGASRPQQIRDVVAGLKNLEFSAEELGKIEMILG